METRAVPMATAGSSTAPRCGSPTAASPTSASSGRRRQTAVRGFLVDTDTPGFSARKVEKKLSLRASVTSELHFDDMRVPGDARCCPAERARLGAPLPERGALRHRLGRRRRGDGLLRERAEYAKVRPQFGKPIAGFQLTQAKLADMLTAITQAQLLALPARPAQGRGQAAPPAGLAGQARQRRRRRWRSRGPPATILGANGISLEHPIIRHMVNLETVITYEGTHEIHTLVLGQDLTGIAAFA